MKIPFFDRYFRTNTRLSRSEFAVDGWLLLGSLCLAPVAWGGPVTQQGSGVKRPAPSEQAPEPAPDLTRKAPEPTPVPQEVEVVPYRQARKLLTEKKWEEAAVVLKKIVQAEPRNSRAALALTRALTHLSRREEAIGVLERLVSARKRGRRKKFLQKRVQILSRMFFTNKAFQVFQEGNNSLGLRKLAEARTSFFKAHKIEPSNVEILLRLAQCLIIDGDKKAALAYLEQAKALNPYEPEIRMWLGRALTQEKRFTEAIEELKLARKELRRSELAPAWLAEALHLSGKTGSAVRLLRADARKEPFHLLGLVTLARLQLGSEENTNQQRLWSSRKALQVAMSRFGEYQNLEDLHFESPLGFRPHISASLKTEIETLMRDIDSRLGKLKSGESKEAS